MRRLPKSLLVAPSFLLIAALVSGCERPHVRQTNAPDGRMPDRWLEREGTRCVDVGGAGEVRTEVLDAGIGDPVHTGETVRVHYLAKLSSGETIRDTHDGLPHEIIVGSTRMICGFEKGVIGMLPGERRRVYVPWALGFGEEGRPPAVPPRADLVFEIDLFIPGGDSSSPSGAARPPSGGGGRRR